MQESSLEDRGLVPWAWSDVPIDLLRAELLRRQDAEEKPACGTKGHRGEYDTPIHVFALVLILVLSTAACAFPIIARHFPRLPIPHHILFISRHFGTGVLIATAFVHLLPTAFVSLTDPCLPHFWNRGYPAMAGLIAMTAVLAVVGIEMFFAMRGAGHSHVSEYGALPEAPREMASRSRGDSLQRAEQGVMNGGRNGANGVHIGANGGMSLRNDAALGAIAGEREQKVWGRDTEGSFSAHHSDQGSDLDLDLDELDPTTTSTADDINLLPTDNSIRHIIPSANTAPSSNLPTPSTEVALQKKLLLQCLLLEAGILFHSIFIGMALSVATGPPFAVLLIAISFHQTFEGLALGARIAAVPALLSTSPRPWLMALAYGTTTPLGQAIGLAVQGLYDPRSQTGLLMVGLMNAVSAGLLLYAGLVTLLAEDFLSEVSYASLRGRNRLEACAAVVGGVVLMALVGAFA